MKFSLKDVALPPKSPEPYQDVASTLTYRIPKKNEYFRVRPDPEWRTPIGTTVAPNGDTYIVGPAVMDYLEQERLVSRVDVFTLISKDSKDIFLSGVIIPDPDQKENSWNTSRRRAYAMAELNYVRIVANHKASKYNITQALGEHPDPIWPDDQIPSLEAALNLVFEDRIIDTMEHSVIQSLLGKRLL